MVKKFKSPVDGLEFIYQIVDGNLEYKIEGTDWQDFIPEDKRAYSDYEYKEFVSLCGEVLDILEEVKWVVYIMKRY